MQKMKKNSVPNPAPEPSFLTVAQAAERMGESKDFVYILCREGKLAGATQGNKRSPWRIPVESVDTWIADHKPSSGLWQRVVSSLSHRQMVAVGGVLAATIAILAGIAGFIADSQSTVDRYRETYPTATPLPFPIGTPNETLILIATFHNTAQTDVEAHKKIQRAIEAEAAKHGEQYLRVAVEPTELTADQRAQAEALGKQYNASIVIWGEDTGVEVVVNFLSMKEPDFNFMEVTLKETEYTQLANPGAYARFVTNDLPQQMTFFALFAIGQSYAMDASYPTAIERIEAAIAMAPSNERIDSLMKEILVEAYFRLAWLYQVSSPNNLNKAIANYDKVTKINPNIISVYLNRGIAYSEQGDLESAFTDYNTAIELDAKYVEAYNGKGYAYYKQGDMEAAIANFNKAIEFAPDNVSAYIGRGHVRRHQGDLGAAIADFNKAVDLDPNDIFGYLNLGLTHFKQGDLEAAFADFSEAIKLEPNLAVAYYNRASVYYTRGLPGDLEAAIIDISKSIELNPNNADAYNNRGTGYYNQGNLKAALADYTKAIELGINDAEVYRYRGNTYKALGGDLAAAIADYNQAIKIDSNYADAYGGRGDVYARNGDLKEAIIDFRRYLELKPEAENRAQIEQKIFELETILISQN